MTRVLLLALVLLALAPLAGPAAIRQAVAVQPDEVLADRALEGRARDLSARVRCLVCQNQSIDDSNADLARDLRRLVRERLVAGDDDRQVLDFLVARYGAFVLLEPPRTSSTWLLWYGPFILLGLGAAGIGAIAWMRSRRAEEPAPLTAEERSRLDALLSDEAAQADGYEERR